MTFRRFVMAATLAMSALFCSPLLAQKKIETAPDALWKHERSKVVFPAAIGDLKRTRITDFSDKQLNVGITYDSNEARVSVYLYRPLWLDVSAWFERGEAVLTSNEVPWKAQAEDNPARAFTRPNGSIANGLRRNYRYGATDYKVGSLAMLPFGDWLLKIRYSSKNSDLTNIDPAVDSIIALFDFPTIANDLQPAKPIAECTQAVKWKKAKIIREDMTSAILNSAMFPAMIEKIDDSVPSADRLCKVKTGNPLYSVYSDLTQKNKYWMLASDSGVIAQIMEVKPFAGGKQYWSIVSTDGVHSLLPAFTQIPDPELWHSVIFSGQVRATVKIDPDAPKGSKPETTINIGT